jgi:hypothetical protein
VRNYVTDNPSNLRKYVTADTTVWAAKMVRVMCVLPWLSLSGMSLRFGCMDLP